MKQGLDLISIGLLTLVIFVIVGFGSIIIYAADSASTKTHPSAVSLSTPKATPIATPTRNQAPIKDSTLENAIEDGDYDDHLENRLDDDGELLDVSVNHTRKVVQKDGRKMNKWTYRMSATIDAAPPFYRPSVTGVHVKTVYTPYEK